MHTAVAAGFTAGWYIEHKLVLTPGHGESTASHPSPDGGQTHGEDAPQHLVRSRYTRIGHPTGAARLFSGSVYAATPRRLGISDTVPRTGCCPEPPPAGNAVSHHGSAEPMKYTSARGAQAPNRGGSGDATGDEVAAAWRMGRMRDAAAEGQPPRGASPRSGERPEDVGTPGAGAQSQSGSTDEWKSRAAAGWAHPGAPCAAARGRLPRRRDRPTGTPPGAWRRPGHAPEPWERGLQAGAEGTGPREAHRGARRLQRLHTRTRTNTHYQTLAGPPQTAEHLNAANYPPEPAQAREVAGAAAEGRVTRAAGRHSGARHARPSGAGSAAPTATPTCQGSECGMDVGLLAAAPAVTPPRGSFPRLQADAATDLSVTCCRDNPVNMSGYRAGLRSEATLTSGKKKQRTRVGK